MVQGYLNLNEAAQALGMLPDELRQMAQKNQIRSFQDRGTLRFRQADIQELARRRGATSDPGLVLPEPKSGPKTPTALRSSPTSGPKSPPRTPKQQPVDSPEMFDFALEADDRLDIGREASSDGGAKSPRSGQKKGSAGSDSDVKLVANAGPDSDVKLVGDSKVSLPESGPKTPSGQRKPGGPASPAPKKNVDSGVRLVSADSDSDVKIVGGAGDEVPIGQQPPPSAADSDIRLEQSSKKLRSEDAMNLTEEINLDDEIKKQEASQQQRPKSRVRPKSELKFPTQSPFELSDSDLNAPTELGEKNPSSSDFELTPDAVKSDSSGSVVLEPSSSDDFSLELPEDSKVFGGSGEKKLTGDTSGINLSNPADAGISLEGGTDTEQLDMSAGGAAAKQPELSDSTDSSSEFELSLDADSDSKSSSEFELTLDDGGETSAARKSPQAKAGAADKDIFETDFEVPALEGDSGSEVAALETSDTDMESSDFDLALDDSDLAAEDESGSQVVALDEESADEAAETIAGEVAEDLEVEVEEEEEGAAAGPVREVVRERLIEPAPWGALPTVFMLPCVVVMILVAIMGFELVQSTAGFKSAGFFTRQIGDIVGMKSR